MRSRLSVTATLFAALLLFASSAAAQSGPLEGTWIGGENGEEDLEMHLVVGPGLQGTASRLGQSTPRPPANLQFTQLGPGFYRAQVAGDDDVLFFLVQSPNRMIAWEAGDDDLGVLSRVAGAPPADLLGDWSAIRPDNGGVEFSLSLTATQAAYTSDQGRVESPLWFIASDGPTILIAFSVRAGGEPYLFNLQPHPEGGYIAWEAGRDDFVVLQRPGVVPSWISR